VIDDFGHNPDKIAATLSTLHAFPGRLLSSSSRTASGPLKTMGRELAETFADQMGPDDMLVMPDRSITAARPTGRSAARR
jgi:UDP-N-acetylmuramate--alanine ligase